MIVANYLEMKSFIPTVQMKGIPDTFNDALETAQATLAEEILGSALTSLLEQRLPEDEELLRLAQRAIALEAFLKSIPLMDLVLTDSGFGVISNDDVAPASKERVASLTAQIQSRLDESKDRLVTFLLRSEIYADWRGTEEFARLSDGLILTLADFRDVAVMNAKSEPGWPTSWTAFLKLNGAMHVALTGPVASYISEDYATELLEKIRDREVLLPSEKAALVYIKTAVAAFAMGDEETGTQQAIKASVYMKAHLRDFPTYAGSSAARDLLISHSDTPIFFMF